MGAPRSIDKFEKLDADLGLKLRKPTEGNAKYRIQYVDPFDGKRRQPTRTDRYDALALWDETVEYLTAAKLAAANSGLTIVDRSGGPIVDDVMDRLELRWGRLNRSLNYRNNRANLYGNRIGPVIGSLPVRKWAATTEFSEIIMGTGFADGLAPASIQNLGSLMRSLVTQAWRDRWVPRTMNPMDDVPYVAVAGHQGEARAFVPEDERPSPGAVADLLAAYDQIGASVGIGWLADRASCGAFGGLRPSEQDALRINDLRMDDVGVYVDESFSTPRGRKGLPPLLSPTKNRRKRLATMPMSRLARLYDRAEHLTAQGLPDNALLFADPSDPFRPLSETMSRRLYIDAALLAGWETVAVKRSAGAKGRSRGPDVRPRHVYYSLRHHSVSFMRDVVEMDWAEISRALGHHSVAFTHAVCERSDADSKVRTQGRLRDL